ncbi:zinc finger matrin-type protein 1 [Paramisgurnus dabryanus]|uniref:zinc finger matrin-type protein 1 n=1 Tax=Paramisgurnus dabryanus TaxID=90735 RepID=UPI0031F33A61
MSDTTASVSCSPQIAETDDNKSTGDTNPETVQNTISNNSQVEEVSQNDNPLKGLLTKTFCYVCEATLLYDAQRFSHYKGKKHAQKVKLFLQDKQAEKLKKSQESKTSLTGLSADPDKFCELCNMVFSSPTVARSHYMGKVHAKNMRKTNAPPQGNSTPLLASTAPVAQPAEVAVQKKSAKEQKGASVLCDQEVNDEDPIKYCKLCKASFNNALVAQQHYSGRKHQRNQTRQQMMDELADQSEHASSLTCPICCVTFSSIEMYHAHMKGNKHQTKEKKVMELCQSQKKVYDSYQDELSDYIQVQKARGLEPKTNPATVGQTSKSVTEITIENPQAVEVMPHPVLMPQRPPPPAFSQPPWHPQFPSQVNHLGFRLRGPVPHYPLEYMSHPHHQFIPGQLHKRRRSPDSYSSSSFSDSSSSSSYTSSSGSTDSSSSYDSRERSRRKKRKMRMQSRKRKYPEDDCDVEKRGREEERGERGKKESKRRKKERSSSEDKQSRSRKRPSRKHRRHGDTHHAKRQKEEEPVVKGEEEVQNVEAQGNITQHVDEWTDMKDGKQKHKKDKKKGKEKVNQEDNRTEEERLWDETILGVF